MPLPDEYNSFEHLQSTCSRVLTRLVRSEFSDIGDADWDPDITTPRGSLRQACTPDDEDTGAMLLQRFFLFYFVIRNGQDFAPEVYGLGDFGLEGTVTKYPQIQIYFEESRYTAANNDRLPVRKRVSFRWREDNFSTTNINQIANKIRQELATPKLRWECGRIFYTYRDRVNAYDFKVYAQNKVEAKKVIEAVYRLQDNTEPEWNDFLREHIPEDLTPSPKFQLIEGENVRLPDPYPLATVEFAWAELRIPQYLKPIILVDTTGRKYSPRYVA